MSSASLWVSSAARGQMRRQYFKILWRVEPLLCNSHEICRAVCRQRLGSRVPAAPNTHSSVEVLLETVFSTRSVHRGYKDNWSKNISVLPCGDRGRKPPRVTLRVVRGGEKGSLESDTVKYGHEFHGTRTRKWLRWRRPGAFVNDRPVLSSERAPHIKSATVWQ
jgi:hypothetical protein